MIGLVACTTSGPETERVYSYNPGSRTGPIVCRRSLQVRPGPPCCAHPLHWRWSLFVIVFTCVCDCSSIAKHELYYSHLIHIYSTRHTDLVGLLHLRISSEIIHPRRSSPSAIHSIITVLPLLELSQSPLSRVMYVNMLRPLQLSSAVMGSRAQRYLALSVTGIACLPCICDVISLTLHMSSEEELRWINRARFFYKLDALPVDFFSLDFL